MKTTQEEALYNFVFGDEYDSSVYNSKQDAVSDLVTKTKTDKFKCDGHAFLVVTDKKSEALAFSAMMEVLDVEGVLGLSEVTSRWAIENAIDVSWFDGAFEEENVLGKNGGTDAIGWFEDTFGYEALQDAVADNYLADQKLVAEFVIETDGVGSILALWDSEETEQDGWMIYNQG